MQPFVPCAPLTLAPDAPIDLQLHTTLSDARWSASELLDHVAREGCALIAHPGQGNGFARFDAKQLDRPRATVPIDGFETRHPSHSPEQVADFLAYASAHDLLVSAGPDSHGPPGVMPIKYPTEYCCALLERLGIEVR
ncbi:MAG TPA: hypothetical protein VFU63_14700 [Ktedonobacterales bacterium]|nr:hypothetical protein [Ktedonobacterales bacterium]